MMTVLHDFDWVGNWRVALNAIFSSIVVGASSGVTVWVTAVGSDVDLGPFSRPVLGSALVAALLALRQRCAIPPMWEDRAEKFAEGKFVDRRITTQVDVVETGGKT
jgi:hypothetical protein